MRIDELTPVKYYEDMGIWLKRDDMFEICGVRGGKSRSAYQVIQQLLAKGYKTMVTAGSRQSPQCEIVSFICEELGIPCKVFMPRGANTSVINHIEKNKNTEIIRVNCGYNNVIIARSREYATDMNCGYVPFGMECAENVEVTSEQVQNIPENCKRIVIPVGSGMSFSSVVTGMTKYGINKSILGVRVGKDPSKIIREYAQGVDFTDYEIVSSPYDYHDSVERFVGDYQLDPIYEAKCYDFLEKGDCLWVVGRRLM